MIEAQNIASSGVFWDRVAALVAQGSGLSKYASDPIGFCRDVLGVTMWERQEEIMAALTANDRVAIRSGHGTGKTFAVSAAVLWWVYTQDGGIVLTTAPTWRQVESVLWREIARLHRGSNSTLPGSILATRLNVSDTNYAIGLSTNEPERFQGYHSPAVMVVEDEAPGVDPLIHEAIEGVLSGGGKWLKIGNPTAPSGPFYAAFSSPGWHPMHISCLDHPNVISGRTAIPGAVSRQWCEDRLAEWGAESPLYQARVLGNFPDEGENSLIRLAWVTAAQQSAAAAGEPVVLAADIARFGGDETVIGLRRGNVWTEVERTRNRDLMDTTGRIVRAIRDHKPKSVVIDDDGLGGGVVDRLREQGFEVCAFRGGETAMEKDHYVNRRTEAWWMLREAFRAGTVSIPDDGGLAGQLLGPTYSMDSKGRIKLEGKDDMKARGLSSPDRADAMAYAWWAGTYSTGPRIFVI